MIRICHLVDTLNMGGLENIVKHIALNLDKAKYYQEIWCLKDKGDLADSIERAEVAIRPFYFEGRLNMKCLLYLAVELRKKRFDILHSHGFFPFMWGAAAALFAGIPVRIASCGNSYYDVGLRNKLKLKISSIFITRVIAVSETVKKSLIEFIGIPLSMVSVIYSSAKKITPKNPDDKQKIRGQLGIKDTDFVVGSIGRLVEHKGHQYMIEALSMLLTRTPNMKYVVIGNGPAMEGLRSKARALGIEKAVLFTGTRRDTEDLLNVMDVFVQPSALREGLPVALAEAASAGLPLIATDVGGNSEIVRNGINGFVVSPKDTAALAEKVLYLTENTSEKSRMGYNSRMVWQEKFTREKMLDEISKVYALYAEKKEIL